ncbi:efflux RND transporter permease subunit [Luteolibacter ambystomatis]|uniref:Efflux RND transporter permease subunit n=1 Tax=Luteolibacter ambystomatis TaxID=2824561 RepID=A0A975G724_9BACT|nr:efflux RND transporter permease subunit [Luteolibacter ambystomatis]QUE49961.1 efflux RND transporter permease subunit [Luteolibacter ambystomatis]
MWIVLLALRRPLTFVVGALLLLLITPFLLIRTPTDIFPAINIPVVSVIWSYTGLSAKELEQRMVYGHERALTTTVNNIEHIESNSYDGVGVVKIFFQPGTSPDAGVAQVTAISQTILRQLPPGTTPPLVIQYNASTVPILQYGVSSSKLNEQQIQDVSTNQIRVGLISVQGAGVPLPYGGKSRLVSVDLNMQALESKNLSSQDVVAALSNQNIVYPSGTAKIGSKEYPIDVNTSPQLIEYLNELPIKTVDGAVIRIRDVAQVRDGADPQKNIVRQDGLRSTLISVLKNGNASTLDVAAGVKEAMKKTLGTLTTQDLKVTEFSDQSLFVKSAVTGVVHEGVIAAALTAIMILLFLGSWRSTIIIAISIPLAVLASLAALSALGQTINLMTLGGLALAVGILVDDATVTIENIERHLQAGEKLEDGIIKGAAEIALPAMVSTLCICIVFVPMFFLGGVAGYLFAPLAMAVVFAVLASYVLSRTLVPTLVMWFERSNKHWQNLGNHGEHKPAWWARPFVAIQKGFEAGFHRFLEFYRDVLAVLLRHRVAFIVVFLAFCVGSMGLVPMLGRDFFPTVDSGSFRLHVRAKTGTRIEETAQLVDQVEQAIRKQIPASELKGILDNIGLPNSGINLSYSDSGATGPADADIMVALKEGHRPTAEYIRQLRIDLNKQFPGVLFYFLPSDIVTQTINFGLPAPFDVQIVGRNVEGNQRAAAALAEKIRHIPGAVDVRVQQPGNLQRLEFEVDRTKASQMNLSERDVAGSILLGLSGSSQVQPGYWLDRRIGVQYVVNVRAPEYRMDSIADLQSMPITARTATNETGQLLTNLATYKRTVSSPIYSHYDVKPVVDIFGGVSGRDLAGVLDDLNPLIKEAEKTLPAGSSIVLRGQAQTMRASFIGLGVGLVMAIILIYFLLVVNFQSWLDPFIILTALFGALAGVVWGLHLTTTTLSVPAMMGAIMCLGVATANSVLVVTFARQKHQEGGDPVRAAWEAGAGRLRPVLMTAAAMIIGMVPMALGLGDGGEQNAPLGRAVIGGLIVATFATLFFVPAVFSLLHRKKAAAAPMESPETESTHLPA